jgi:nucleoside-diphosphate-sugar epimerase
MVPMKILVLGGTQFVGRHIVEALLAGGHAVSVFNRGRSNDELPGDVERVRGDRDHGPAGLTALTGRTWDVCVDVSGYTARQVRSSAETLRKSVGRYVFISAVSVYGDPPVGPVDESQPCLPPAAEDVIEINAETYGPLKFTCENIVQEMFADRCALLRPQVVAGPYDPLDRFSYWVRRAGQGGDTLAPGDGSDFLQYIDAGDVARFARMVCENCLDGPFNLAGPRLTWSDFIATLGARNVVWVPKEIIAAAGVTEFELPLYRPTGGRRSTLMHVSNERAVAAGLTLTDPTTTIENVRRWLPGSEQPPALSPEREAALIAAFRSS